MKRTDAPGHVANKYSDGDALNGILATVLNASAMNAIQEEIALAIEGAGIVLNPAQNNQLLTAINSLIASRYASNADFNTGTATDKTIVPSNFVRSLAVNGYIRLPGGVILQWGSVASVPVDSTATVTFPIAFPTACWAAIPTLSKSPGTIPNNGSYSAYAIGITATSFGIANDTNVTSGATVNNACWFAIGN